MKCNHSWAIRNKQWLSLFLFSLLLRRAEREREKERERERRGIISHSFCFVLLFLWVCIHLSSSTSRTLSPHPPTSPPPRRAPRLHRDAVQHCHQHQHHCIQILRLRWLTWKQNGKVDRKKKQKKKHVWNMKARLRNLARGIYEAPLRARHVGEWLGISRLYCQKVQKVHSVVLWLFFFFFFLERVRDKLLINLGFYSPSVKNAIYLKGVALSRSDLGGDYSLQWWCSTVWLLLFS